MSGVFKSMLNLLYNIFGFGGQRKEKLRRENVQLDPPSGVS